MPPLRPGVWVHWGDAGTPAERAKGPDIVCTTGMVADVVRNVVGDHYTIGQLMGEGVDPHIYDPTPADARALE